MTSEKYKQGDKFIALGLPGVYLLAGVGTNQLCLINISTGQRLLNPITVTPFSGGASERELLANAAFVTKLEKIETIGKAEFVLQKTISVDL